MVLTIDGLDILPYIAEGGIKWQRSDFDSADAGRTMDGVMHRGRVATKIRLDITFMPLETVDLRKLLNALYPEYVTVRYTDPMYGERTAQMYANNIPAQTVIDYRNGTELWDGFTTPLIER